MHVSFSWQFFNKMQMILPFFLTFAWRGTLQGASWTARASLPTCELSKRCSVVESTGVEGKIGLLWKQENFTCFAGVKNL